MEDMPKMTARHIYIDETKERGYVLAASTHVASDVDALRKTLRDNLVLRGQARIHMATERDSRRREISDIICRAGVTATVCNAEQRYRDPLDARAACLQAIVADIPPGMETLLVVEQDDSILHWDKQFLYNAVRAASLAHTVRYVHHRARTELLLSVPDAIAWCWARGGSWRKRILPAVSTVRHV
jgi:hypothetical protein